MHPTQARFVVACGAGDASFARSFDPCASILTTHGGVKSVVRGEAVTSASRLGKPARAGGTNTGAGWTDVARLAAYHRSREGEGAIREKRKEVEASVPARIKGPGSMARTSCFVAEVDRRRLASNTLGKRAPKRAVRVE
jgi:hypothetical protein